MIPVAKVGTPEYLQEQELAEAEKRGRELIERMEKARLERLARQLGILPSRRTNEAQRAFLAQGEAI